MSLPQLNSTLDGGTACTAQATVSDAPGGIARLTATLHEQGACVKDIFHER
jgi:hypothetical protein